ncbi:thermostable hemolysin [Sphingomonas alba]|uniref:Thermostable hemolysin n=1 Tax=Sphingomonas alba TaxID=2908208 RepID=A0ABT0RPA6_9SPHN|nr:thermostable hemolysin [Sphingomonas alba]MCL6684489.1 thermostable hemolysin [Sphingomonas alba]
MLLNERESSVQFANIQRLIEQRYGEVHGAIPSISYPHFCAVSSDGDIAPSAALGFRIAAAERLFLEDYLDAPIEIVVEKALGTRFARDRIVEIGAHASNRSRATLALWARTARELDGIADVAVAVLTAPLRAMFERLGVRIVDLGDADPARLPDGGKDWGRYYELRPRVCAGMIAPALPKLSGFDKGMPGLCA